MFGREREDRRPMETADTEGAVCSLRHLCY